MDAKFVNRKLTVICDVQYADIENTIREYVRFYKRLIYASNGNDTNDEVVKALVNSAKYLFRDAIKNLNTDYVLGVKLTTKPVSDIQVVHCFEIILNGENIKVAEML